jgi:hypothetical protein
MLTLYCPTCRGALSVAPAALPYVVACPRCRNPLTVPAAPAPAPPAEPDPLIVPSAPRSRERYRPGRRLGPGALAVGLLVALAIVAAAVFIVGRVQDGIDRRRLADLHWQEVELKQKLRGLQLELVGGGALAPGALPPVLAHVRCLDNKEYRRLHDRLIEVVGEHNRILDAHPEWGARRATADVVADEP